MAGIRVGCGLQRIAARQKLHQLRSRKKRKQRLLRSPPVICQGISLPYRRIFVSPIVAVLPAIRRFRKGSRQYFGSVRRISVSLAVIRKVF